MDYTPDEIEETLTEMGYSANPDAIEEIRQELIGNDAYDENYLNDALDPLIDIIQNFDRSIQVEPSQEVYKEYPQIQELIYDGYDSLQGLHEEINEVDLLIEEALHDCPPELRQSILDGLNLQEEASFSQNFQRMPVIQEENGNDLPPNHDFNRLTRDRSSNQKENRYQPTGKLPSFEFDADDKPITLDRKVEKALIDEVLKQKGAVRVPCPPPGKAPFKHDPVKRNAQYQDCWKQFPEPGAKRRASLRWKIRDLMLNRDIPYLKLVPNPGFVARKDWMD